MKNTDVAASQRLRETIDYKKIRPAAFARLVGFSQPGIATILSGKNKGISSELAEKITAAIPEINAEWLLWGRGEMLRGHILKEKYVASDEAVRVLEESGEVYETWAAGVERRLRELEEEVKRLKSPK